MTGDFTTREEVREVYRRRARNYDITANLYYLIGFREQAFRRMAVKALGLAPGDTVVEIGCGTGLNFPLLQKEIGKDGRIIGVDISEAMLEQAKACIRRAGWSNVKLVCSDAASYQFPAGIDGILSTFALTLEPDYDVVIARGAQALKPGKRWVLMDLKLPSNWLRFFTPLLVFLVRPFAVSEEVGKRHPWESIERHLTSTSFRPLYFGLAYLSVGAAKG
jgi:demethylmenaquinone methyltransferase/2-methoxy-6-polyprenyl-1,4-benzoquinol methylase